MARTARPILFSGPMVRALLDGRKTQTRRIIKRPKGVPEDDPDHWVMDGGRRWRNGVTEFSAIYWPHDDAEGEWIKCPYGVPGDLLWVRESMRRKPGGWAYMADETDVMVGRSKSLEVVSWAHHYNGSAAPSIHMPRWASRLTLEITEVRVERLQDISEVDAIAEGWPGSDGTLQNAYPIGWYAGLWDAINGKGAYDANPWTWAISFTAHQQNVDAFLDSPPLEELG